MGKLKKISLIIAVSITSLFLLILFILFNFPYTSVIKRVDFYLKNNYSTNLSVLDVRYRFPSKFLLDNVKLMRDEGSFEIDIDHARVYLKLLNFSKVKKVGISAIGLDLKSDYIELTRTGFSITCGFRLSQLLKEPSPDTIDFLTLRTDGVKVEQLNLAGFEFSQFKIPIVDFSFLNDNGKFVVERGLVKSNLFSSEISGGFNFELIDGKIIITLSNEFFKQYAHLKSIVDRVANNDVLTITIKGSIRRPAIRFL